nr:lysylphosphatidylglycerol synthase transmembrane domain-containing protein [Candidatus Baldrarchaeota archaeon]
MVEVKKWRIIVQLIVGAAILLWLLHFADAGNVLGAILQINPLDLVAAAFFFIIASTFVGLALYIPIRKSSPKASLRKVITASFAGQLISDVTPVRSGYFITPIFLNELANVPVEQGMVGVLTTAGVNSLVKVLLCIIGLGYFASFLQLPVEVVNTLIVGITTLFIGGVFLLLLMWEKRIVWLFKKLNKLPLIGKSSFKLVEAIKSIQENGKNSKHSVVFVAFLIFFSVLGNAAALYILFNGIRCSSLSIIDFLFIASISSTLTYVPITIAGLGVQEVGYVILLSLLLKIPISPNSINSSLVAFALIVRALFTGTDIIGIVPLLKIGFKNIKLQK